VSNIRYGVVGAGRQGTAAAYDLIKHGDAASVTMFDREGDVAEQAADRLNRLSGRAAAFGVPLDVAERDDLTAALEPLDIYVCAVPYVLIPACTAAALDARTSMVDLGGHTGTVLAQLEMDERARAQGVTIVPDCGMGPGLNNTMGMYVVARLEEAGAQPISVRLYDGGLPQHPPEPWGYQAAFHIDGLTNEYDGEALFLRQGKVAAVPALTEPETLMFEPVGELEAFVTSGGTSTVPFTLEGKLETYENKTLRYPGHLAKFKAFKDLGLFERTPRLVQGREVSPREVFHALLGPQIETDQIIDICLMRARGSGVVDGKGIEVVVDLIDRYEPETGFAAMERLTGWHAAIMAGFIARGQVGPGVHRMEQAVPPGSFMEEIRTRGFQIEERWE
jgi:lysine 6-dehydrogenase